MAGGLPMVVSGCPPGSSLADVRGGAGISVRVGTTVRELGVEAVVPPRPWRSSERGWIELGEMTAS